MKKLIVALMMVVMVGMCGVVWGEDAAGNNLIVLLERCKEFIHDNTKDLNTITIGDLVYRALTEESYLEGKLLEAQNALEKAKRETQLRKDIEEAIRVLNKKPPPK